MLVKNSIGELITIKIQNQSEYEYLHRMAYGTSKLSTEYISLRKPYSEIKKGFQKKLKDFKSF